MSTELLVLGGVVLVAFIVIAALLLKQSGGGSSQSTTLSDRTAGASRTASSPGSSAAGPAGGPQAGGAPVKNNWLLGKTGGVEGKSFHIGEKMVTAGRDVGNYLQVRDETVSSRHTMLIGTPHGMQITDLDSSNGTFVNGRQLGENEEYNLEEGDTIEIGDTLFVYQRSGRHENDALTHKQAGGDSGGKTKTAMSMKELSGGGDLKQQVLMAVGAAGGDYEAAADELGLDVEIVEQIVRRAND